MSKNNHRASYSEDLSTSKSINNDAPQLRKKARNSENSYGDKNCSQTFILARK